MSGPDEAGAMPDATSPRFVLYVPLGVGKPGTFDPLGEPPAMTFGHTEECPDAQPGDDRGFAHVPILADLHEAVSAVAKVERLRAVAVFVPLDVPSYLVSGTLRALADEIDNGSMPEPNVQDVARWRSEYEG